MSQRERDLDRLAHVRQAQDRAVSQASSGSLEELLDLPDSDDRSETYVVKILDVTPGVGKVAGRRMLASLGIGEFTRLRELSGAERVSILSACREMR